MKERHELAFLDLEASAEERKILDIGALREDETVAFQTLPKEIREVYAGLLKDQPEFRAFWTEMHMYGETEDLRMEPAPEEILLQLGHRDVVLSFFRSRTAAVGKLRAGIR